ncbi:uncharacterized protein LOC124449351 [Xenia sp. Carnegie-2017]|uniref:uncharacterized protein LOC124449351 n=1 Tax=Xenia sp. Carnegie-2017 TaxID=2897299 RepID=UPI001F03AA3A|nr:uncharacterized protein LOC124449351 [Xenia sp. Carnegie-2017]
MALCRWSSSYVLGEATDAFPKGKFVLGTKGSDVTSGFNEYQAPLGYGFSIHTPDRVYEFSAGTEDERDEWVKDLKTIVSTSLTEEDRKAITLSEDLERKKSQQSSLSRISQNFHNI